MATLTYGDVGHRLIEANSAKRMPLFSALEQAYHWRTLPDDALHTYTFDINQHGGKEDYLTCMSLSKEFDVLAVGSGNRAGNLYFVKDMSVIHDTEPSVLKLKPYHREKLNTPIYSMDWSKEQMLIGTHQGVVKRYSIQEGEGLHLSLVGQYVSPTPKIQAGPFLFNTHIKSVQFSPIHSSLISCTMMNQLNLWFSEEILQSYDSISESPLQFANWSPHQTLVVSGGYDRKLFIVDSRIKDRTVWSADCAHDRPIQDAKFNPFIPYWLASSGEDSVVNIWDIRASQHSPVAKIDGNIGSVNSITWSNIRPENIGTASSDGFMRYWSLCPESFPAWDTHYRITRYSHQDTLPIVRERDQRNMWCIKDQKYKHDDTKPWKTDGWNTEEEEEEIAVQRTAKLLSGALHVGQWGRQQHNQTTIAQPRGPVVSLKTSSSRPGTYYSITSHGQLSVHSIRFDITTKIKNRRRFDPESDDKLASQIEDNIYCRRIQSAQQKLEQLKSLSASNKSTIQNQEDISFLEDCLVIHPPIQEADWQFDSLPDSSFYRISQQLGDQADTWQFAIDQFRSDLKYWNYRIPPGYNKLYNFSLEIKNPNFVTDNKQDHHLSNPKEHVIPDQDKPLASIKARRNMDHVTSIVTTAVPSHQENAPHTPPYSGASQSSEAYTNINPFEQKDGQLPVEHSPPSLQESKLRLNPFEQHSPPASLKSSQDNTNPFLNHVEPQQQQQETHESIAQDDRRTSTHSSSTGSWISSSHHLGLRLSRHSTSEESVKSNHSIFNPFKSIKSFKMHKNESKDSLLKRESSTANRRNALHGPF